MQRQNRGRTVRTAIGGEQVNAFIPNDLPPDPPIHITPGLQEQLNRATFALGKLDGISAILPDKDLFLYFYLRKEAVLSSQIEGTQSSLADLMVYEMEAPYIVETTDIADVAHYVAALNYAFDAVKEDRPITNRLLRHTHSILLRDGRGSERNPGEFRTSQNWIGGSRPGNAAYVPPPANEVIPCMAALEKFINLPDPAIPALIRAGMTHVQFETIHPFLDGNGRLGRMLITLMLCRDGLVSDPLLYLSLTLKERRTEYYQLLQTVRHTGDWEAWVEFFLQAIEDTARGAIDSARRIVDLLDSDRKLIGSLGQKAGSALKMHESLKRHPVTDVARIAKAIKVSRPTAMAILAELMKLGIVRQRGDGRRNRLFEYGAYLDILGEGGEPIHQ